MSKCAIVAHTASQWKWPKEAFGSLDRRLDEISPDLIVQLERQGDINSRDYHSLGSNRPQKSDNGEIPEEIRSELAKYKEFWILGAYWGICHLTAFEHSAAILKEKSRGRLVVPLDCVVCPFGGPSNPKVAATGNQFFNGIDGYSTSRFFFIDFWKRYSGALKRLGLDFRISLDRSNGPDVSYNILGLSKN